MQECFDSKDIDLLKKTIAEMSLEDAQFYMKRCVDSGLWVPGGGEGEGEEGTGNGEETEEPTYAEASEASAAPQ